MENRSFVDVFPIGKGGFPLPKSISFWCIFLTAKTAKALSNLAWGSIDTEGGEWVEGTQPGDS